MNEEINTHLPKKPGIYKITCLANGKVYIGSSVSVRDRISQHFHFLRNNRHQNKYLQRAFNKYGEQAFDTRLVGFCEPIHMLKIEGEYIQRYRAFDSTYGYNLIENPQDNGLGRKLSEETKRKLSECNKGTKNPNYGKPRSEETRRKISAAHMGRKLPASVKAKLSEINKGKKRAPETTAKIIAAWERNGTHPTKGKKLSAETRQKISLAQKGIRTHSAESRVKIGNATRGDKNPSAKLTVEQVIEIKHLLHMGELKQAEIARKYGVTPSAIYLIKKGKKWSHVEIDADQ